MDLHYSPEEIAFRDEVRSFLQDNLPASIRDKIRNGRDPSKEDVITWQRILNKKGWATPSWPTEWGGTGWTALQRYIFLEENYLAFAPQVLSFNVTMIGPIIAAFGREDQKAHFLPRVANLDDWWCQGFSEPGAGSDLASLKTSAVIDGDDYVLNGQKIWTSYAHKADWMFCLVRTDPNAAKKHNGITMLLIDMKNIQGMTIRKIETIDGGYHVNEVFFDNLRVPVKNRVGEENKGWDYARYLLSNERLGQARIGVCKARIGRAREIAVTISNNGQPLSQDPIFLRKLAVIEAKLKALEILQLRALSAAPDQDHRSAGIMASILKVRGSELQQATAELLIEMAGPLGARQRDEQDADAADPLDWALSAPGTFFYSRASSIYGGTNEIQRNLISRACMD